MFPCSGCSKVLIWQHFFLNFRRIFKLDWLESLAFGVLMSCKGLVALVMFNIAADRQIISPRLFTMLVVYCIVATFVYVNAMSLNNLNIASLQ
jgi:Kef-type K+ transport system membrane component KefB